MADIENFDLIVIGGGPGGYVGAIRAAQLGLKTACVEGRGALGGTCLNVGCIPSKALLESSHLYHMAKAELGIHGIQCPQVGLDLSVMQKRRFDIVKGLTKGIEGLFKKNKITYLSGWGRLVAPNQVSVKNAEGKETVYQAQKIVIATGSEPIQIPSAPFDGKDIISSTEALELSAVPKHMVIVGGGVIGLELGSVWSRLGAKVTILEAQPAILPGMDKDIVSMASRIFAKQGLEIFTEARFLGAIKDEAKGEMNISFSHDGSQKNLTADKLLVCVGRKPFTTGLGLEGQNIKLDNRGRIEVDKHYQTSIANIYAIGDVIKGPMLAHKAEEEGIAVAELIANKWGHVNYRAIPGVVYTFPEIASLGMTEDQCQAEGLKVKIGKFPFAANGRAKTAAHIEGFVKLIADEKTDKLLGCHILGPQASELISEAVMIFEYEGSAEDMARSVHAHPTLAEALKEAALDVHKQAIHI